MEILIAEDNTVSQKLLNKIVRQMGHNAILAKNGKEALEMLKKNNISMVITDWMMPEMDGVTLCRKIREAEFSSYIYLILLTAKDSRKDALAGFKAGSDDYIIKPFNHDELKAKIRVGERIIKLEDEHKKAGVQLVQSEKMASIGQLAAGVAHEINNPTGFVSSNLKTLSDYQNDITSLVIEYRKLVTDLNDCGLKDNYPSAIARQVERIENHEKEIDIDFIMEDINELIGDCKEGTDRIKKIVIDLKDFAHPGENKLKNTDINKGIETTLSVVWNELKYKARIKKEYGDLPVIKCYPQQLNQVFMNILVNAAQAMEEHGEIGISTIQDNGCIQIKISDTGTGIAKENLTKIFDPFFTTKDVGKGTGLGMNVAYNIIQKHNGTINVESTLGKGTTFTIRIPVDRE